jgi:hypothetical protein
MVSLSHDLTCDNKPTVFYLKMQRTSKQTTEFRKKMYTTRWNSILAIGLEDIDALGVLKDVEIYFSSQFGRQHFLNDIVKNPN